MSECGRALAASRPALVRRGLWLNYITIGYNTIEAVVALTAGLVAGSVALVGFGVDSVIEVSASIVAQWRLRADLDPARRERVEHLAVRIIGGTFLALAAYVTYDSITTLVKRQEPDGSVVGVILLSLSVVVMPLPARAKRWVAGGLGSSALTADATQTSLCAYLSVIALAGVALNTLLGWWWADPAAALAMVPIIIRSDASSQTLSPPAQPIIRGRILELAVRGGRHPGGFQPRRTRSGGRARSAA